MRRLPLLVSVLVVCATILFAAHSAEASSAWTLIYDERFNDDVPLGRFSDCGLQGLRCEGLRGTPYYDGPRQLGTYFEGATTQYGGVNRPSRTVSIADGVLKIAALPGGDVGAILPDATRRMLYGKLEFRIRTVLGEQHGEALRTLGILSANASGPYTPNLLRLGEIDPDECTGDRTISQYLHPANAATVRTHEIQVSSKRRCRDWHTVTMEWLPERLTYRIDGKRSGQTTDAARIPGKAGVPFHFVLRVEPTASGVDATTTVEVDSIRAWRPDHIV